MPRPSLRTLLLLALLLLPALLPHPSRAEGPKVTLEANRHETSLSDSLQLTLSVSGTADVDGQPALKGLADFEVTPGGTSSRVEMTNGHVEKSIDYLFYLQPRKEGRFEIGPAEVRIDGHSYLSNTLPLVVVKNTSEKGLPDGPVFLTADLKPAEVYVDQPAFYTLKLHLRTRAGDLSLDLPDLENLPFTQLGKPSEYSTTLQGQPYRVVEIHYAILPAKAGTYPLSPARMQMTVYDSSRSLSRGFFADPFSSFARERPLTVHSGALELKVSPLPEQGRPGDFSGLVGKFDMTAKLDPSTLKVGESATLTVTLEGHGNVSRMPDIKLPPLDHVKTYGDQPVLDNQTDSEGPAGRKTMKWALVPEESGHYDIPPVSLNFFDPEQGAYRRLSIPRLAMQVTAGDKEAPPPAMTPSPPGLPARENPKAVTEIGRDILPIHTASAALSPKGAIPSGLLVPALILFGPFLAAAGTLLGLRLRKNSDRAAVAARARKASQRFIDRFSTCEPDAPELNLALREYLNERLNLSIGLLTPSEAAEILGKHGVQSGTVQRFTAVLDHLEDAIYAGRSHSACEPREDLPPLIRQIEKELR